MNPSNIEEAIQEIEDYVDGAKQSKFNPNKVVVDRDELLDLVDVLREAAPKEIKRYQKIISNRDAILNEAKQKSEAMLNEARAQSEQLLNQNDIVQMAYAKAEEIMNYATTEAENIMKGANEESEQTRRAALVYTHNLLDDAQKHITEALKEYDAKQRQLTSALKSGIQIITNNKAELAMQLEPEKYAKKQKSAEAKSQKAQKEVKAKKLEVPEKKAVNEKMEVPNVKE